MLPLVTLALAITAWQWSNIGGWLFVFWGIFLGGFFHPLWFTGFVIGGTTILIGVLFLITPRR